MAKKIVAMCLAFLAGLSCQKGVQPVKGESDVSVLGEFGKRLILAYPLNHGSSREECSEDKGCYTRPSEEGGVRIHIAKNWEKWSRLVRENNPEHTLTSFYLSGLARSLDAILDRVANEVQAGANLFGGFEPYPVALVYTGDSSASGDPAEGIIAEQFSSMPLCMKKIRENSAIYINGGWLHCSHAGFHCKCVELK